MSTINERVDALESGHIKLDHGAHDDFESGHCAMQVVDLASGEVVWRDSSQYPEAGESILPDWDTAARVAARRDLVGDPETAKPAEPESVQAAFDFGALA